jgi:hypothetical protein
VTFVGLCLPDPACETVVVQTGIGHGEDVIGPSLEQRFTVESIATLGTIVTVCWWMAVIDYTYIRDVYSV